MRLQTFQQLQYQFILTINPQISPQGGLFAKWTFEWGLSWRESLFEGGGLLQSLAFSSRVDRKIDEFLNQLNKNITKRLFYNYLIVNSSFFHYHHEIHVSLAFCLQWKEVILYIYYSAIMLPSNKAPWGHIQGGWGHLFAKESFQVGFIRWEGLFGGGLIWGFMA